jgi:Bacterial Ig-like domain (group 3)
VTFLDGATKLGTGTLTSGSATYATSALVAGSHSITAQYGGDTNFAGSTSSAVTITVTAVAPSFALGASPTSVSISTTGSSGTTTLTVTPAGGFAQPVSFACTGLPSEASCTFAPSTVTPGATAATTVLTISTTAPSVKKGSGNDRSSLTRWATFASLGMLILTFRPSRNRIRWLAVLLTLGVAASVVSCGGGSSGSGGNGGGGGPSDPGTPTGTSTVTVTATAGSLSQTVSLSVAVQ